MNEEDLQLKLQIFCAEGVGEQRIGIVDVYARGVQGARIVRRSTTGKNFTAVSLAVAHRRAGLVVGRLGTSFGNQFLWADATPGAPDDGAAEYIYRFAPLSGIYGGTLEVFRNMIAQYVLDLGKPAYAPPAKKVSWV